MNSCVNAEDYEFLSLSFPFLYTFLFVCVRARVRLRLLMLDVPLPVMMHQHVDNFFKHVRLLWAKEASGDLVNSLFQLGKALVVLFSVVSKQEQKKNSNFMNSFRKTEAQACCLL